MDLYISAYRRTEIKKRSRFKTIFNWRRTRGRE